MFFCTASVRSRSLAQPLVPGVLSKETYWNQGSDKTYLVTKQLIKMCAHFLATKNDCIEFSIQILLFHHNFIIKMTFSLKLQHPSGKCMWCSQLLLDKSQYVKCEAWEIIFIVLCMITVMLCNLWYCTFRVLSTIIIILTLSPPGEGAKFAGSFLE